MIVISVYSLRSVVGAIAGIDTGTVRADVRGSIFLVDELDASEVVGIKNESVVHVGDITREDGSVLHTIVSGLLVEGLAVVQVLVGFDKVSSIPDVHNLVRSSNSVLSEDFSSGMIIVTIFNSNSSIDS